MKSATRKILIGIVAIFAAVFLALGAVFFVRAENRLAANDDRIQAAGDMESFDKVYKLENGSHSTKWAEVLNADNAHKKLYVILVDTWNLTDPLQIPANFDITFNLNGKSLDRGMSSPSSTGNIFTVNSNAKLTITDTVGTGKLINGYKDFGGGAINVAAYGTLIINGGTIENCKSDQGSGGAIIVQVNGNFTMNGGKIQNCSALNGGGICILGTGVINNGAIKDCTASYGGAIANNNGSTDAGKITINGGEFTGNDTTTMGGAVFQGNGEIVINGGAFDNNYTIGNGGGIAAAIAKGGKLTITGGSISGNYAGRNKAATVIFTSGAMGGGICITGGSFVMDGGTVANNTAMGATNNSACGGGIFTSANSKINAGTITQNSANGAGGGIYISNITTLGNVSITNNKTTRANGELIGSNVYGGGGVWLGTPSHLTVKGATVIDENVSGTMASNLYLVNSGQFSIASTANGGDLIKNGVSTHIGVSITTWPTGSAAVKIATGFSGQAYTTWSGDFFFPDRGPYAVDAFSNSDSNPTIRHRNGVPWYNVPWKVQITTDGGTTKTWYDLINDEATVETLLNGKVNGNFNEISYPYSGTTYITGVKVDIDAYHGATYHVDSTSSSSVNRFHRYEDSFGGQLGTDNAYGGAPFEQMGGAKNAGNYLFGTSIWLYTEPTNVCNHLLNITVEKKDITVNLNQTITIPFGLNNVEFLDYLKKGEPGASETDPRTPYFTLDAGSSFAPGDTLSDIELDYIKGAGTDAGFTYLVTASPAAPSDRKSVV